MHTLGAVVRCAEGIFLLFVNLVIESRVERKHHLVVVAAFLIVKGFATGFFAFAVHVVHAVPVNLSVGFRREPEVLQVVILFEQVGVIL